MVRCVFRGADINVAQDAFMSRLECASNIGHRAAE